MSYKRLLTLFSFLLILSLVLVACGGDEEEPTEVPAEVEEEAPPPEEEEAPPPEEEEEMVEEEEEMAEEEEEAAAPAPGGPSAGSFLGRAYDGEFAGTEVLIQSVLVDEDEAITLEGWEAFEEATGIDIVHAGTKEHETQITVQVESGNAPDIAMFSQPSLLRTFVDGGYVMDVRDYISEEDLQERYAQGWLDSATFALDDGEELMGGVWWKAANKDLVWYPKATFDAAGYEVPTTWDELLDLTQMIADDGDAAWCLGIESGVATGWVATDWIEALLLRTTSPENYDAWVAGELPFSSPEVKHAAELMSEIWLNPDYVLGGTDQIISEFIGDTPTHMFEDPPTCWLHRQASWIQGFFGEGLEAGTDWDFFYLPGVDPMYGEPVLMAGDIMTMFNDRDEVKAVHEYLSTADSIEVVVKNGRGLSPHQGSSLDWYTNDIDRNIADILLGAEIVRFDGGDMMPAEVGTGSFWSAMVDYVSGVMTLDEALQFIDDSWPEGATGEASVDISEDEGEPSFLDRAYAGEFAGTEVLLQSVLVDEDEAITLEGWEAFEEATGIDIVHAGTKEHETQITVQVESGNAPDIAMFSQPSLLQTFVDGGYVMDVREFISEDDLQDRYAQGWLDSATLTTPDGEEVMGGVWWKAANKDLVWYPKATFEAAGYEVPTTWDEMLELTQLIADDGDAAWCLGIESGVATGWVATDWIEALMLRTTTPENYDAWVAGDLPFNSPEVTHAAELMSEIWLNPDYVLGGTDQIISEFIGDTPTHMFEDPPTCWLHRQASWIQGFFGEGLEAGVDWDFFYLPGVDPMYGEPVLMAGDIMTLFNDRDEVKAVLEYLSTADSVEVVVKNGRGMSPHSGSSLDWYTNDIDRNIADILLGAEIVRFDGGDMMPAEVGTGSFWSAMVDYVSGVMTLEEALQFIDDSWPE